MTRRLTVGLVWALSIIAACGIGWWAGAQATTPPAAQQELAQPIVVTVVSSTVGLHQSYPVTATWDVRSLTSSAPQGVLTSVAPGLAGGLRVAAGDVLYTVDLQPAVAIRGDVPAFRDLTTGAEGADVLQFNQFLAAEGYLAAEPAEQFSSASMQAAREWGTDVGWTLDEVVPRGMLVFLPDLPLHIVLSPEVRVGDMVSPGQSLLGTAAQDPRFTLNVLPESVSQFTPGTEVVIQADQPWPARVEHLEVGPDNEQATIAVLTGASGASICGDSCEQAVTLGGRALLSGIVTLVPEARGPTVPTSAIWSDAAGSTCVTTSEGEAVSVEVLASSDGKSVVRGIEIGERVLATPEPSGSLC